jgi:DNA-binding transcriptional LysR family regulator
MNCGGIPPIGGIPLAMSAYVLALAVSPALTRRREPRHAHRRHTHTGHSSHRRSHRPSRETSTEILLEQRIRLSFCVVRVGYAVDDCLCLIRGYLLIVRLHVAEVVSAVIAHAHTVVGEVDIAVVAEELRHREPVAPSKWNVQLMVCV